MSSVLNIGSDLRSPPKAKRGWFYIFSQGFLFAGNGLVSKSLRLTASILLSLTGEPFDVDVGEGTQRGNAFIVRPGVLRSVTAPHTPMLSVGLCPAHENFRPFSTCPYPGALWALPHADFSDDEALFHAAHEGLLAPADAGALGNRIADKARRHLPEPPPIDARIAHVRSVIDQDPHVSMKRLASEVEISYHRLSHLFSQEMGITLRMYTIQQKLELAGRMAGQGMSLTQIAVGSGFADSAHFCRTWMRNVGSPPSQLLSSQYVGIRSTFGPGNTPS